jgi:hypothetical protein
MLALGLVLNTLGIGLFCWAIFALAVYALPFFVALSIGMTSLQSGGGVAGALLIGTTGGALTLVLGQTAVVVTRSLTLHIVIATAFAVPAAVAGYHLVFALSQIGVSSMAWREVLAFLGAICVGGTAWTRLTIFAEAHPFSRFGRWRSRLDQFLRPPSARMTVRRLRRRTGSRKVSTLNDG